jgi:ATP-dependent Clp protease ATP-binding subunit ClpC
VLILTTNLGTCDASKAIAKLGFAAANDTAGDYERMKQKVTDELKQHFRPEFLNRIDDTIVHPLSPEEIVQIVDLMTTRLDVHLRSKDMGLELTPAAKTLLVDKGLRQGAQGATVAPDDPARDRGRAFREDPLR